MPTWMGGVRYTSKICAVPVAEDCSTYSGPSKREQKHFQNLFTQSLNIRTSVLSQHIVYQNTSVNKHSTHERQQLPGTKQLTEPPFLQDSQDPNNETHLS